MTNLTPQDFTAIIFDHVTTENNPEYDTRFVAKAKSGEHLSLAARHVLERHLSKMPETAADSKDTLLVALVKDLQRFLLENGDQIDKEILYTTARSNAIRTEEPIK